MKKQLFLLFTIFLSCYTIFGQCPTGNIYLTSQQDVDDFVTNYPSCTEVFTLAISGADTIDLSGLNSITTITSNLSISGASNLLTLTGLDNITSVGGSLSLVNNSLLSDLSALNNITQIGDFLKIQQINTITSINFLTNLTTIGGALQINSNANLEYVDGLNALTEVGAFIQISGNANISDISNLNTITSAIQYVQISGNAVLHDISGLNGVETITSDVTISGNGSLNDISGFSGLTSVDRDFSIISNNALGNITGFQSLNTISGDFLITENELLSAFSGFSALHTITGNFEIIENPALNSLANFTALTSIGEYFTFEGNTSFVDFTGFQSLTTAGGLTIRFNDALETFLGFEVLTSLTNGLHISYNDALLNVNGFDALTSLGGGLFVYANNALLHLNAFNNIQSIGGDVTIGTTFQDATNNSLSSLPFQQLQTIGGDLNIAVNGALVDLSGFNALQTINGHLDIEVNHAMTDISGFNMLTSVGNGTGEDYIGLALRYNESLQYISGFNALETIDDGLLILTNGALEGITGFQNVAIINDYLFINENDALTDITGFGSLTTINGDLRLGIWENSSYNSNGNLALTSLAGLESLNTITGDLYIVSNPSLLDVDALSGLNTIGGILNIEGFEGEGNGALQNLNGLSALSNIGGDILINNNNSLVAIGGLSLITEANGRLAITGNASLLDLTGLDNLTYVEEDLSVLNNPSLLNLQGLNSVYDVEDLQINGNDSMVDLSGLESLEIMHFTTGGGELTIYGNENLVSLDGIENLRALRRFSISNNPLLTDISGLSNVDHNLLISINLGGNTLLSVCNIVSVCNYLSIPENSAFINYYNGVGCQNRDAILEACTNGTNSLSGTLVFDQNNNGCNLYDTITVNDRAISIQQGAYEVRTFTDSEGAYKAYVETGDHEVIVDIDTNVFHVSPSPAVITFDGYGEPINQDFCVTVNQITEDVRINILPTSEARPGFESAYQLVYQNMGTTSIYGEINFEYDETMQNFISPLDAQDTNGDISFNYYLEPFETKKIDLVMLTLQPPAVNGDDVLVFNTSITINETDANPEDNVYTLEQIVVNSYDPNDKTVLQGAEIDISEAGNYLDYIIRFQNTGTASAINVRIVDELNDKLDWSTIEPIASSHTNRVQVNGTTHVAFIFDDIDLPAQQDDDAGSNGFIAFRIKPKNNVVIGDVITGNANIYFDYNPAIVTNTVSTEIVDALSIAEFQAVSFIMYPNPANNHLTISGNSVIDTITIYDVNGRALKAINYDANVVEINITDLSSGIYFIKIQAGEQNEVKKIIKK
ncbi:DUF7619 domain-containing protein [Lacinutrix cladophorae]